ACGGGACAGGAAATGGGGAGMSWATATASAFSVATNWPKIHACWPLTQQNCHHVPSAFLPTMSKVWPCVSVPANPYSVPGPLRALASATLTDSLAVGGAAGASAAGGASVPVSVPVSVTASPLVT